MSVRSLLLQPKALPRYQPEFEPLKQLGHNDFHLHLSKLLPDAGPVAQGEGEVGKPRPEGERPFRVSTKSRVPPLSPPPHDQLRPRSRAILRKLLSSAPRTPVSVSVDHQPGRIWKLGGGMLGDHYPGHVIGWEAPPTGRGPIFGQGILGYRWRSEVRAGTAIPCPLCPPLL